MPFSLFSSPIPPPIFTPSSLLDLSTKVYLLTPLTPPHLSLLTTLYTLHATIYIGAPSPSTYRATSSLLLSKCPSSKGTLKPFIYNASDLASVQTAAQALLKDEWRLDVLFLDTQLAEGKGDGEDAKAGILAAYLIATLLLPLMRTTASHFCHPNPSIRVVWVAKNGAARAGDGEKIVTAVYRLAMEFARSEGGKVEGGDVRTLPNSNPMSVQHVFVDMAMPESRAQRFVRVLMPGVGMDPEREACTLLYAGLAPDVRSGDYIIPLGRKGVVPDSVMASAAGNDEMGTVEGSMRWCSEHTRGRITAKVHDNIIKSEKKHHDDSTSAEAQNK